MVRQALPSSSHCSAPPALLNADERTVHGRSCRSELEPQSGHYLLISSEWYSPISKLLMVGEDGDVLEKFVYSLQPSVRSTVMNVNKRPDQQAQRYLITTLMKPAFASPSGKVTMKKQDGRRPLIPPWAR